MIKTGLFLFMLLFSSLVLSNDIYLGTPGYGGSGCPAGSASIGLSPDLKSLSIIFDEFIVEAGGRKRMARKSCNIAIPVHVPQGMSVSIIKVDYRGFISQARGSKSRLSTEYFFAGKRGPKLNRIFKGALEEDFTLTDNLALLAKVWSKCGKSVNLRVNTSLLSRANKFKDETLAMIDSADFKAGLVYHLKWKYCH
jgi:hypothetical protein